MTVEDIRPIVINAIRQKVAEMLRGYEIESCEIEGREDAAGDDAIFITVHYRLVDLPYDSGLSIPLRSAIWKIFEELRERRIPYLRLRLNETQEHLV